MWYAQVMSGLLPELQRLRAAGLKANDCPATAAIGYRQGLLWLDKVATTRRASDDDIRQLAADIQGPSRRLHKAQLTFHRKLQYFQWIDACQGVSAAAHQVAEHFHAAKHVGVPFESAPPTGTALSKL